MIKYNKKTSKRSNAYKTNAAGATYDPSGVAQSICRGAGYKHIIPSGLDKEIMENLKGLRYEQVQQSDLVEV